MGQQRFGPEHLPTQGQHLEMKGDRKWDTAHTNTSTRYTERNTTNPSA